MNKAERARNLRYRRPAAAWERLQENPYDRDAARQYETLLERLPDVAWVQ